MSSSSGKRKATNPPAGLTWRPEKRSRTSQITDEASDRQTSRGVDTDDEAAGSTESNDSLSDEEEDYIPRKDKGKERERTPAEEAGLHQGAGLGSHNAQNLGEDEDLDAEGDVDEEVYIPRKDKGKEREHTPAVEAGPRQDDLGSNIIQDVNDDEDQDSDEDEFEEEEIAEGNGPLSHHAIWNRLLNYAARLGTYTYAPAHGKTPGDVTAFEPSSASWGKDQADRPPVLSLWMSRPGDAPTYTLESLKYRGRIVQDWEGKDIQTFRGLPLTIASTIEGFRVEAWLRADHRMKYRDIVARMRTRDGPDRRVPIYKERALASRAVGFRDHAGCIAWHSLSGNMQGQTYMDSLRTPYQRANNLITGSDLTMDQLREFRSLTRKSQGQTTPAVVPTGVSATPGSSTLRPRRATNIRTYHVISSDNSDEEAPVDAPDEPTDPPKPSPEISESDSSSSGVEIPWDSARSPYPILSPSESSSSSSEAESSGDSSSLSRLESDREADPSRSPHSRLQEDSDTNTSTASPSSEPENPADVRNLRPRDMDEGIILSAALWRTREHFKELTGRKAPQVPLMENYFSQWATLQEHLRSLWTSQGRGGNVPLLYGLDAWVGSIGNWRSAAPARTNYVVAGGGGSA